MIKTFEVNVCYRYGEPTRKELQEIIDKSLKIDNGNKNIEITVGREVD